MLDRRVARVTRRHWPEPGFLVNLRVIRTGTFGSVGHELQVQNQEVPVPNEENCKVADISSPVKPCAAGAEAKGIVSDDSDLQTMQGSAELLPVSGGADDGDQNESSGKSAKIEALEAARQRGDGHGLTTNQGLKVSTTDHSLKAGDRGPTLLEDFHLREKMTHFDHERMPERVVHARGSGAHGYFQPYESAAGLTKAAFLADPTQQTPVFVRFSTVLGSRGSADTVRDVRGFATKFYTSEGNFDLVGNNIPVFFIQDAVKFPDLVHALKPEPPDEMPQATAAHDTAWDFFSLLPETTHMVMWAVSDRAIPRSFRMMEGFGVHTFRMINAEGVSRFVKFHWKPMLGVHSLVWDEAQKLNGKDPDWLRRDLWNAIEQGHYPEFELGVQVIEESDEHAFNFDILDATKIWPEELVPVQMLGKMTLNRNPDNFFAETEQVAFHPGHIVPGIDFTNDPLLQGRLFSYLDTQINRFSSANFAQLPINRPICPVHNNQVDGFMRRDIPVGRATYFPNSIDEDSPEPVPPSQGGFESYPESISGRKVRARAESFNDHFTQARLFYKSLSEVEQKLLADALRFELGKVKRPWIRERMVKNLSVVDMALAKELAQSLGVAAPDDVEEVDQTTSFKGKSVDRSPVLGVDHQAKETVQSRRIAILVADGVDADDVDAMKQALTEAGAQPEVVAKSLGTVTAANRSSIEVDKTMITTDSVMYDAVYVPGGSQSAEMLSKSAKPVYFVAEAFGHYKPIAASGDGIMVLKQANLASDVLATAGTAEVVDKLGVVTVGSGASNGDFTSTFLNAIAQHRFWDRPDQDQVPAI
jgi:catalase